MIYIEENLKQVIKNIEEACRRVGRNPKDVTLIAVSKTKPIEMLQQVYDCGIREFGENYVQEMTDKIEHMPKDIKWHMIGHLQRNKVKYIIDKVAMIHSVDSLKLAQEISKEAVKKKILADILVEVNVGLEDSKFGILPEDVENTIQKMAKLPSLRIRGLMTSAPFVENSEDNRWIFKKLSQLCIDIKEKNIDNSTMDVLSMGMTNDYIVAVEEGATMVRVGTAIFGARDYNN